MHTESSSLSSTCPLHALSRPLESLSGLRAARRRSALSSAWPHTLAPATTMIPTQWRSHRPPCQRDAAHHDAGTLRPHQAHPVTEAARASARLALSRLRAAWALACKLELA